jgi:exodeoxyribonuclease III
MKLVTWNVNGIRAVAQKGFLDYLAAESPDVLCLQETKAHPSQLDPKLLNPEGYTTHWSSATKKGYSGVAIFYKKAPRQIVEGMGIDKFDAEGRTLIAEYEDFILFNGYYPNGQHDLKRVGFKLEYSDRALELAHQWKSKTNKPVILTGDFNTAHQEIDLARPKANEGNTGFLPEERAWITKLLDNGFVDIFRAFESGPHHYSWWSYRAGARPRNIGWRIDYFFVTPDLKDRVKKVYHQPHVMGSDHCPIVMELL